MSKRRFGVIITRLLCYVFAGCPLLANKNIANESLSSFKYFISDTVSRII